MSTTSHKKWLARATARQRHNSLTAQLADGAAKLAAMDNATFCAYLDEIAAGLDIPPLIVVFGEIGRRLRDRPTFRPLGEHVATCPVCRTPMDRDYLDEHNCPGWREDT